jgi:nanoRNase/pAp phosphatase (c-di-AMP/oligoRNAs hydrolase)
MKNYTHVLYHDQCPDGFGSAFAAWKVLGKKAEYIGLQPSDPAPVLPKKSRVIMVDVAFPLEKFLAFKKSVKDVVVLDHHITNQEEIGDLPGTYFDINHSGAYLSWVHFHKGEVPEFIRYLEDRDLWRFDMPYSREVGAALPSYPYKFEIWAQLMDMGMEKLKLDGGVILRYQGQVLSEICASATMRMIDGHLVPCANTIVLRSETGDKLCQLHPTAPFSAYYFERNGKRCWGLRSPGRMNVAVIAKKFGGGGHANAAGFTEELSEG